MRGPKAYCCRESILKHILAASPNETPAKKAAFVQKGGTRTPAPDIATRRELVVYVNATAWITSNCRWQSF